MTETGKYHTIIPLFFILFPFSGNAGIITGNLPGQDARGEIPVMHKDSLQADSIRTDSCAAWKLPFFTGDPEYMRLLGEGLYCHALIDSLSQLAVTLRKDLIGMGTDYEKHLLQRGIVLLEDSIKVLERSADSIFRIIAGIESQQMYPLRPFLLLDTIINGIRVYSYDLEHMPWKAADTAGHFSDTAVAKYVREGTQPSAPGRGITGPAKTDRGADVSQAANLFDIRERSPYSYEHYFDSLFVMPRGVFYWIQLAAFINPPDPGYFGGIWPVTMVRVPEQDFARYYAGRFTRDEEARNALEKIHRLGFQQAFIVGYFNGQKMSLQRLRQFEKAAK